MRLSKLIFILLCMLSLGACKEEYVYPNVLTELTELQTDENGRFKNLITDRGESFGIAKLTQDSLLVSDTLYRALTVYAPIEGETDLVHIYSANAVFSKIPVKRLDVATEIKTDPVDIQSIWRSGRYLNMILRVQVKNSTHVFHFIEDGITANSDGTRTLSLTFHHDRKKDYEAFTQKICFSIPLWYYESRLQKGDKICLSLNTYKEGVVTKEFIF